MSITPEMLNAFKAEARATARKTNQTYCQALDAIARREGQRHWKALQALAADPADAICQRCSSPLLMTGRCSDETCPFSDHPQNDPRGWAGHPERDENNGRTRPMVAVVKFSELAKHGRMDAGFHIALDFLRDRIDELRSQYTEQQAIDFVRAIPLEHKQNLSVLQRGQASLNTAIANQLTDEYPHFALALIEHGPLANVDPTGFANAIASIQAEIDKRQDVLDILINLAEGRPTNIPPAPSGFQAGMTYPLLDPEHFDDDLGEGYTHVALPDDSFPGMVMVDAWPVNPSGEVHPGYDQCPVPIRLQDVDLTKGYPNNLKLPVAKQGFWR